MRRKGRDSQQKPDGGATLGGGRRGIVNGGDEARQRSAARREGSLAGKLERAAAVGAWGAWGRSWSAAMRCLRKINIKITMSVRGHTALAHAQVQHHQHLRTEG